MTEELSRVVKVAGCVVQDGNGKVLLIHRRTERFVHWELPGGKVEEYEDEKEAAAREFEEETGVPVDVVRKLGSGTFSQVEDNLTYDYSWFLARQRDPKAQPWPVEDIHDNIGWFSWAEINRLESISANVQVMLLEIGPEDI